MMRSGQQKNNTFGNLLATHPSTIAVGGLAWVLPQGDDAVVDVDDPWAWFVPAIKGDDMTEDRGGGGGYSKVYDVNEKHPFVSGIAQSPECPDLLLKVLLSGFHPMPITGTSGCSPRAAGIIASMMGYMDIYRDSAFVDFAEFLRLGAKDVKKDHGSNGATSFYDTADGWDKATGWGNMKFLDAYLYARKSMAS